MDGLLVYICSCFICSKTTDLQVSSLSDHRITIAKKSAWDHSLPKAYFRSQVSKLVHNLMTTQVSAVDCIKYKNITMKMACVVLLISI